MDNIWRRRFAPGYQRLKRPVMAYQFDYPHGSREIWHSHEQGQLVHALRGVVRVLTPHGAWTVAPTDAFWIAPGVDHELHMVGRVPLRALRIEPDTALWLWTECRHIAVGPLLRELILAMLEDPPEYAPDSTAALCVPLLLRQLQHAPALEHGKLPLPRDKRLLRVCELLMETPGSVATMDVLGMQVGASMRTLGRLFKRETGLTFGQWRQQLRLAEAICQLSLGTPVASVARELGYATANAFSTMFHRALGAPPQRYIRQAHAGMRGDDDINTAGRR
ncbi:AraC family transcriptional regulator [Bordetella sp. H567]|uniref:AraC family transcriptional regulator n=1 Tax=Bordetella sp. H567 TaxID=1697043 RepID=UPI00081C8190|nr:helix-turn-helix transcriptional regulator [Bordetella sp. H567]AOB31970.1 AraC family transcriptional regulator [Bordetella sp. H567]